MKRKPPILVVTRNLPPLVGGMENLLWNTIRILDKHYECTVIGPKGCGNKLPMTVKTKEVPVSLMGFLALSTLWSGYFAIKNKYEFIFGGSGLASPGVLLGKIITNTPAIVYVHGLDLVVNSKLYQAIFLTFIKKMNLVLANSENTKRIAESRGVREDRLKVLNPGTDLPKADRKFQRIATAESFQIKSKNIILFVGRITRRKGLKEFIERGLPLVLESNPDTTLLVVGEDPPQSLLKGTSEKDSISNSTKQKILSRSIVFAGAVDDAILGACYAAADCLVFPLIDIPGDIEGFGMVAIEAAAHGTPTVAFRLGGVADSISDGHSGHLADANDYKQLSSLISEVLAKKHSYAAPCLDHAARFSWDRFENNLFAAISGIHSA